MASLAPESQPLSAEDEALKRNTDCVYFLASPLTCKKGSECEYRHSDIARVNPRDCWFWLNGNCLNPKCGFRHPPLEGLLETQVPTPTGLSVPLSQTAMTPAPHVPNASSKQAVPCIFFQKGLCLKGDWCPFVHGPNAVSNKGSLVLGTASTAEPAPFKKAFGGLEKSAQDKKVPPKNVVKYVNDSPQVKPTVRLELAPPRNEFAIDRKIPRTSAINEFPSYRNAAPLSNGNPVSWSTRVQQPHLLDEPESLNSKDAEEVSREPSPGFDVLVDDEGRDSDYYPGEDRYGMSREHESRNEYDIGHSTDYNTIADIEDERYKDPLDYDSYEHRKGQNAWEQHRASTERMSGGSYLERRPYGRHDSLSQVDELDLRHRLAKQKKPNGLRSVINHEHARDRHARDRSYEGLPRDERNVSRHENSLNSRLRGRIRLPERSSHPTDMDITRGIDRGRLSPGRANLSSHQGRIRDRIKGRLEEAFNNGGDNHRGLHSRRDTFGENNANFAAPKSLAELKNRKNAEPSGHHTTDQQSLGKRKHLMLDDNQETGGDISFEGPKPLQEILKRKRGGTIGTVSARNSSDNEGIIKEENNQKAEKDATNNDEITPIVNNKELEAEDGIQVEEGVDQECEAYEHRDGESDYEQEGGEDLELYDGENIDAVEEYIDEEDDDDDFAKKMGVMYS
ncbi:hypothetical protein BUALT_Bualt05G0095800 [Buddleja alternifolia]|uniref:C3H1-type domain-containing protein n=1 Tax=Buddleja alternifolia TaxID=168488 RepID=A0AAV6XJD9_9LAMI|nr:hypothetical protein BUALT_Bualt05G0095800 [Buddleja alternifolia]